MTKKDMLENLVNHYTDGNKAAFAKQIGISASLLSKWLERNTFDAETLYQKCNGVSAEWLLTGEGEMFATKNMLCVDKMSTTDEQIKELMELCKSLVANYQQRDDVMNKLVSMFK